MASVPGLEGKPIESVENACASGGQAVLSVVHKLLLGQGDVGIAVGYEKMRDDEGKMDGKLIGQVLGYFSHPDERAGKVFVFPHIFAEVMAEYMKAHGVSEQDLAAIAVAEYANAQAQPLRPDEEGPGHARAGDEDRGHQPLHRRGPAPQDLRLLADQRRLRVADPGHRGRARQARRRRAPTASSSPAGDRPPTR